jgi:hypothetical protein
MTLDRQLKPDISKPDLTHWLDTAADVADLIAFLGSPNRDIPVVVMSPDRERRFPLAPEDVAEELRGVAVVYALSRGELAWELDPHREYRTYGGAVRIVGGSSTTGAVIRTDGHLDTAFNRIVNAAGSIARRMPQLHAVPAPAVTVSTTDTELAKEREARKRAEDRAAAQAKDLTAARSEIARLRAEIAAENLPLFGDPEDQFRDDVQRTWLRQVTEPERDQWPLREFRVGPEFLNHLDFPQAPREKIIEVVVDVLTRRAYSMPSRSVRPHGDGGPAGTNGQIIRPDGAAGYRCNIRANTPQAPRLLFWELTDGTVELALAGLHDAPMPAT